MFLSKPGINIAVQFPLFGNEATVSYKIFQILNCIVKPLSIAVTPTEKE